MFVGKFLYCFRPFCWILAMTLLILAVDAPAWTQSGSELQLANADWRVENGFVTLTYDLIGKAGQTYEVSIVLLKEDDSSFEIVPKTVRGDVGKEVFAGKGRSIRWDYRRDVPNELEGDGYQFEILARQAGGGSTLLYYALGGAAVAGVAAVLLLKKSSDENITTPVTPELPLPPARP